MRPPRCARAPRASRASGSRWHSRAAGEQLGERGPARAEHAVPLDEDALLLGGPLAAADVGFQVVQPAVAALLAAPAVHLARDEAPLPVAKLIHQPPELVVLVQRPLLRAALESALGPAVSANLRVVVLVVPSSSRGFIAPPAPAYAAASPPPSPLSPPPPPPRAPWEASCPSCRGPRPSCRGPCPSGPPSRQPFFVRCVTGKVRKGDRRERRTGKGQPRGRKSSGFGPELKKTRRGKTPRISCPPSRRHDPRFGVTARKRDDGGPTTRDHGAGGAARAVRARRSRSDATRGRCSSPRVGRERACARASPGARRARGPRTIFLTRHRVDAVTKREGGAGRGRGAGQRASARPSRGTRSLNLTRGRAQRPRFPSRAPPLARSGAQGTLGVSHGKKHSPGPYESNCRARVGYGAMRDVSRAYLDEPEQRVDVIVAVAGVLLLGFPRGRSRGGLLRGSPPLRDRDRGQGALLVAGIFVLHSRRGRTRGVRVRVRADVRRDRARTGVTGVGRPLGGSVARLVRASCSARGDASETKKRAFRGRRRPFSLWRLCVTPSVLERSSDRAPTRGREQTKCSYGTRLRFFGRCREHVARFFSGSPIRSPRSLVRLVRDSRRARRGQTDTPGRVRESRLCLWRKTVNPDRARSRVSLGRGTMASMASARAAPDALSRGAGHAHSRRGGAPSATTPRARGSSRRAARHLCLRLLVRAHRARVRRGRRRAPRGGGRRAARGWCESAARRTPCWRSSRAPSRARSP